MPPSNPRLLHANPDVARLLGLSQQAFETPGFLALCSGQQPLPGAPTIATVYSGHQFGVWAGQLGDGRAHLLGDVRGPDGWWEVQLKGSGRTPYARMGDGRAVLRSSVREYLASEAMAGLGIPTTRALALVVSNDPVYRETIETAAVVTRIAPSFLRFGHFEHWGHTHAHVKTLFDYTIDRFFPQCRQIDAGPDDTPAVALAFLREVVRRTAQLMAQWQLVGFCHGVMNTDNMSILGLTLDYGPYGFMDTFDARHVCNHTDTAGRYAWNAQPAVAHWNLYRLAGSLMALGCDGESLKAQIQPFEAEFLHAFYQGLARKFGLSQWRADDAQLADAWWSLLQNGSADFTLAFRHLAQADTAPKTWLALFSDPVAAQAWLDRYLARVADQALDAPTRRTGMDRANPLYILRNHLAQAAIEAAQNGDAGEIDRLLALLRAPYTRQADRADYAQPPPPGVPEVAVSCSS